MGTSRLRRRRPDTLDTPSASPIRESTSPLHKRFGSLRRASQWVLPGKKHSKSFSEIISHVCPDSPSHFSPNNASDSLSSQIPNNHPSTLPVNATPYISYHHQPPSPVDIARHQLHSLPSTPFVHQHQRFASNSIREAVLAIPDSHQFERESVNFRQSFTFWRHARLIPPDIDHLSAHQDRLSINHELSETDSIADETACLSSNLPSSPDSSESTVHSPPYEPSIAIHDSLSITIHPECVDDSIPFSAHYPLDDLYHPSLDRSPAFGDNPFEYLSDCGLYVPKCEGQQSCRTSLPLPLETIISTTCWNISPKYKRYGVLLHNGLDPLRFPLWMGI